MYYEGPTKGTTMRGFYVLAPGPASAFEETWELEVWVDKGV